MRATWLAMTVAVGIAAAVAVSGTARADTGPELSVPRTVLDDALECTGGDADLDPVLLVPGTGLTPGPNFDWNHEPLFAEQGRWALKYWPDTRDLVDDLVSPAGSSPHISTAQPPAGQADDRPEYNQYEGRSSTWPAETCIRRYTQRTSGEGH